MKTQLQLSSAWTALSSLFCLCLLWIAQHKAANATDLTYQKLFGRWAAIMPAQPGMGDGQFTTALSDKWALVGAPGAEYKAGDAISGGGVVQVFNAATGAWVRRLSLPLVTVDAYRFGQSIAINGDLALIGARGGDEQKGEAHLFNVATGSLIRTLTPNDGIKNNRFGYSTAISGNTLIVGAYGQTAFPGVDGVQGAVYLFDLASGLQLAKLQAADGGLGDGFGYSVAVEGGILAIGSPGNNAGRGAVYFYDLSTQSLIQKFQPNFSDANDGVGIALAMHEGRVVMGCSDNKVFYYDLEDGTDFELNTFGQSTSYGESVAIIGPLIAVGEYGANSDNGAVHLFNAHTGAFLSSLESPNADELGFGRSLSLHGTTLLAAAPFDQTQSQNAGSAVLIRAITQPMPLEVMASKGSFAPGTADTSYGGFGDVWVNGLGELIFSSSLTGAGSSAGRDRGVFSDLKTPGSIQLLLKHRQSYAADVTYTALSAFSLNDQNLAAGRATLAGKGVNSRNNQLIWYHDGSNSGTLLRNDQAVAELGGGKLLSTPELAISNQPAAQRVAAICTLRQESATGVDATGDSGLWSKAVGGAGEGLREGAVTIPALPAGSAIGQFAPRLSFYNLRQIFCTALTGTGITTVNNAALFSKFPGAAEALVAQKNDEAVLPNGNLLADVRYSAFLGECSNDDNAVLYRASLSGLPAQVNTSNNEGLWLQDSALSRRMVLRKGDVIGAGSTAKISRIVQYWALGSDPATNQALVLVQLTGTGVNASNDQALLLSQTDRSLLVLIREGDVAPGCPGARIGTISRVQAEPFMGNYAVIASLAGASAQSNLAFFLGKAQAGNTTNQSALRRPFLRLRKGQTFDNQPRKVQTLNLPSSNITASGAAGTGRGQSMSNAGYFVLSVGFENGAMSVVKGRFP